MIALRQLPLLLALAAVGFLLSVMPVPPTAIIAKPHWLLLIFAVWLYARGNSWLLGVAVLFSLMQDAAHGVTLGLHGLALLLPLALLLRWRGLLVSMPLWQATLVFSVMSVLYVVLLQLLDTLTGETTAAGSRWLMLPATVILWPLAAVLLQPRHKANPPA